MKLFKIIEEHMLRPSPVSSKRMPTFYPSSASCRDQEMIGVQNVYTGDSGIGSGDFGR